MCRTIHFVQRKKSIQNIPKDLPLFFVAGSDDPVGNFGKGVRKVYESCLKAGAQNVELKLYENDRHEILNETDYMDVFEDLRKWLEENFEK